jgi:hypothetical protein
VHRPRPTENGGCAAGGTGTPFPPCSVSQESPVFVSLTIPLSNHEKMGASPDMLLCGFGGGDVASALPPKLARDDDLNALLFRPTRDSDPCHQTARSSNF